MIKNKNDLVGKYSSFPSARTIYSNNSKYEFKKNQLNVLKNVLHEFLVYKSKSMRKWCNRTSMIEKDLVKLRDPYVVNDEIIFVLESPKQELNIRIISDLNKELSAHLPGFSLNIGKPPGYSVHTKIKLASSDYGNPVLVSVSADDKYVYFKYKLYELPFNYHVHILIAFCIVCMIAFFVNFVLVYSNEGYSLFDGINEVFFTLRKTLRE